MTHETLVDAGERGRRRGAPALGGRVVVVVVHNTVRRRRVDADGDVAEHALGDVVAELLETAKTSQ